MYTKSCFILAPARDNTYKVSQEFPLKSLQTLTLRVSNQSMYRVTTNLHIQDYDRKQTMVQPHTLNQITTLYVSQSYDLIDLYFKCSVSNSSEEGEGGMRNEKWEK